MSNKINISYKLINISYCTYNVRYSIYNSTRFTFSSLYDKQGIFKNTLYTNCFALAIDALLGLPGPGLGGGGGSPDRLYKAPTDYTKQQNSRQSPDRLTKPPKGYKKPDLVEKPKHAKQRPQIFDKSSNKCEFDI